MAFLRVWCPKPLTGWSSANVWAPSYKGEPDIPVTLTAAVLGGPGASPQPACFAAEHVKPTGEARPGGQGSMVHRAHAASVQPLRDAQVQLGQCGLTWDRRVILLEVLTRWHFLVAFPVCSFGLSSACGIRGHLCNSGNTL